MSAPHPYFIDPAPKNPVEHWSGILGAPPDSLKEAADRLRFFASETVGAQTPFEPSASSSAGVISV